MGFIAKCRDCNQEWNFHDDDKEPLLCASCQAEWSEYKVFAEFMSGNQELFFPLGNDSGEDKE